MRGRRKAREIALQVLYSLNFVSIDVEKALDLFWGNFTAPQEAKDFAASLVHGTWEHKDELDKLISGSSDNWSLGRMSKVDISILRMAAFEFTYCEDIPPKVTINEAIDLGKTFGSENSGAFINGILDALKLKISKENETASPDKTGRHSKT
ncbi:MAG TPA: transcription antitermination factor NusB [Deltaproteobacteria bacterium]|nr:transcription antitermination factor NusB [Deltaproteobacteria bacterium]